MIRPEVVFFDMDHTILDIDASVLWKKYLCDLGLAPAEDRERVDYFLKLYHQGRTPVEDFVKFQYREFIGRTIEEMRAITYQYFEEHVRPFILPDAQAVVDDSEAHDIPTVLLTGTNRYIAEPIVEAMRITTLLPTEPEIIDGKFTGGYIKPFLIKQAKLQKAREHCHALQTSMERAVFFADSINDLEMLESVGYPVAVNPHENLLKEAQSRGWPVEHWSL
jgi:HAD superfamily phosphoserine phosphatase-like hydrolase